MAAPISRRRLINGSVVAAISLALPPVLHARSAPGLTLHTPDGRAIAVSEWWAVGRTKGIILFSHGAASSPRFYEAILSAWAAAGYHVLAPLHVDSQEHPDTARYQGLASWKARLEDMRALSAHIGKRPWIAAGHSYGGLVALTLGGATAIPPQGMTGPLSGPHVKAVIALSPPAPIPVLVTAQGYAGLAVPALIQTGTTDIVPGITDVDGWKGHLVPFDAAPAGGNRYALVLEGVDHYFGGAICRYDRPGPKQSERLADANRVTTQFLKAFGEGHKREQAKLDALLSQDGPVRLLKK